MEEEQNNNLQPALVDPNLPRFQEIPQSYRLAQISKIRKFFEEEIEFRKSIFSKYKKAFNVITRITHSLNAVSAVAGSATVASFAGVITSPIGIGLGSVTIATDLFIWFCYNCSSGPLMLCLGPVYCHNLYVI